MGCAACAWRCPACVRMCSVVFGGDRLRSMLGCVRLCSVAWLHVNARWLRVVWCARCVVVLVEVLVWRDARLRVGCVRVVSVCG